MSTVDLEAKIPNNVGLADAPKLLRALEKWLPEAETEFRESGKITTEIAPAPEYYFAENYHQQYLAKNPMGYCGLGGTGVSCPVGIAAGGA